jgi:hypothetical protein
MLAHLCVVSALLTACASSPPRSARRDLRLDTETVSRIRHAAAAAKAVSPLAPAAGRTVASQLAEFAPVLLTLLDNDNAVGELEEQLKECAQLAEREVNAAHFGNRAPTREECGEEVVVDGCGEPITRAMQLGQQKHERALQCAREVLEQLWPATFSIERRYRYYQQTQLVETITREEEARLLAQGCTSQLRRTIKPDLVLHYPDGDLRRSALTLDFKFPCPDTNEPRWTRYGDSSAFSGYNQGQIYKKALEGEALIISPRVGMRR